MYDRILFPTDGSGGVSTVFGHVLDIAAQQEARVHVLNVADTTRASATRVGGEVVDALEREGESVVEEAADRAERRDVPVVTDVVQGGIADTIVAYADEFDIDLIAMPTHGREGLTQTLLGSVTERVMRRSRPPVLVLPPGEAPEFPYRNILVPTDGGEAGGAALASAVALATVTGAPLHVLTVVEETVLGIDVGSVSDSEGLEDRATRVVADAAATARDAGVGTVHEHVSAEDGVTRGIESSIETHDIDLVVMGRHDQTGVDRYLLGSATERTVRTVPIPVLTVRDGRSDLSTA